MAGGPESSDSEWVDHASISVSSPCGDALRSAQLDICSDHMICSVCVACYEALDETGWKWSGTSMWGCLRDLRIPSLSIAAFHFTAFFAKPSLCCLIGPETSVVGISSLLQVDEVMVSWYAYHR